MTEGNIDVERENGIKLIRTDTTHCSHSCGDDYKTTIFQTHISNDGNRVRQSSKIQLQYMK